MPNKYINPSLTQEDGENLRRIGEKALQPLGIVPSYAAVIRYLVKFYNDQQTAYQAQAKKASREANWEERE